MNSVKFITPNGAVLEQKVNIKVGQAIPTEIPHDGEGKIVSRKTWTTQEINAMSSSEYARNMTNPDFIAAIDAIPSRHAAKAEETSEETPSAS